MSERERESAVAVGVLMRALHTLCQIPNRACQKRMFSLSLSLTLLFALSCCSPSPRHESTRSLSLHVLCSLACVCVCVSLCALLALNFHFHFSHTQKKKTLHTHTLKPKKQNCTHNCSSNGTCSALATAHAINPRVTRRGCEGGNKEAKMH